MKTWFVYILECNDGSFYTGISNDVERRMKMHANGKGSKYVFKKGFKRLLFTKPCENRSHATKVENKIKKLSRDKKLEWFNR